MKKLSKKQALKLLPLIIDKEASEEARNAFFRYIKTDKEVKKKYDSLLLVKKLLKTKYTPEKAPDHLKNKISELIDDMKWEEQERSRVDNNTGTIDQPLAAAKYDTETYKPQKPILKLLKPIRYLAAATVIFFFSLLTIELLEKTSAENFQLNYDIEELALSHFNTGDHVSASLATYQPASSDHASDILEKEYSHQLRLPKIKGATLRRVFYTTFADGYKIPALEFYQEEIGETVHVFAFRLDDLVEKRNIKRDPEAIKLCKSYDDYHIKEIEGKHVVSWRWGNYWYTAASNHNGNDLIALVEPDDSGWSNVSDGNNNW